MGKRVALLLLASAVILALLLPFQAVAAGEEETGGQPRRIEEMVRALSGVESPGFAPAAVDPAWLDEAGREAQRTAFRAYYDYRTDGFDHRRRVFEWQLLSSKVIFVLVVSRVAVGVYFSWLQFREGLRPGSKEGFPGETTFEATGKGIKVSSPILGVIILTISLAFFYLYLVYVYPIEEIL